MKVALIALVGLGLVTQTSRSGLTPNPESTLTSVERPTGREIERCFRGLQAGVTRISFEMRCVLDAEGVPRQCNVSGMSEPQNRMLQSRVNCLGERFRFVRNDGGPTEGLTTTQTITFRMQ